MDITWILETALLISGAGATVGGVSVGTGTLATGGITTPSDGEGTGISGSMDGEGTVASGWMDGEGTTTEAILADGLHVLHCSRIASTSVSSTGLVSRFRTSS